ncbi:MAG: ATP-grasp domain-containing protein [Fimbriimonadales bacterium]|nr:ATP-grasp domain-containing protein [Fimbriimonadales bacterium]
MSRVFRKVLIANRGEIARRILAACREMGIRTVAVYSEADKDAPFVHEADEAYWLGDAPATESYLAIDKILAIAQQAGVDAIHPGYGFLAENPDFAQACQQAGVVFIGPEASVIRRLGDKGEAKRLAERAGAPIVPGFIPQKPLTPDQLLQKARQIGFPLLLKAVAGGGGKGMRIVQDESEFLHAAESASREAEGAFGDPRLMLERYLPRPRHIEVQILADHYGKVLHLYERECSLQRRYQKIIEESPSPALDAETRTALTDAAVRIMQAAGYTNAGTVEFLLEETPEGAHFYFLEVNTRLQVEHPVTEMVTGLDLVHWQLRIAAGEPLPFEQGEIGQRGHAIEARLYAEDPANDFAPSLGTIAVWHAPHLPGVRLDSGVEQGSAVTHHYDPLLAKIIAWGVGREQACHRLISALQQMAVLGVRTNLELLIGVLSHPAFQAGALHTGFLQEHAELLTPEGVASPEVLVALAILALTGQRKRAIPTAEQPALSVWEQLGRWRLGG